MQSFLSRSVAALLVTGSVGLAQNQGVMFTTGVPAQIDVPRAPASIPTRGLTVEAWITYDDATIPMNGQNYWPTIVRHTDTPNAESFIFRVQAASFGARGLAFAGRSAGAFQEVRYNFLPGEFSNWTHVAATFDGSMGTIYVGGMMVAQAPIAGPLIDGGGSLRIGNGDISFAGNEVWNGGIDEVRVWPFARTQAEIQESMNDTIAGIPGGLTFNLDGFYLDTSQGLMATTVGTVPFIPGPPLGASAVGASSFGTASTTCTADLMDQSVGSTTRRGNLAFSLVCYSGPANAMGGVLLSGGALPAGLPVLGFDLWVGPTLLPVVLPIAADGTGVARAGIALSATTMQGLAISSQFVFVDPVCSATALTASRGLTFTVN